MNRRSFLRAAPVAGAVIAAPALVFAFARNTASIEDLEKYYAFLWAEFSAVANELGIERFDAQVMQRGGGQKGYDKAFGSMPPSYRAKAVLSVIAV